MSEQCFVPLSATAADPIPDTPVTWKGPDVIDRTFEDAVNTSSCGPEAARVMRERGVARG